MKKIVLLGGGIVLLSLTAAAQDLPKLDFFAGYSYIHYRQGDPHGTISANANGGDAAVGFYPKKWLGIVGDLGISKVRHISQGSLDLDADTTVVNYLVGPKVRFSKTEKFTPFAQVLVGGAHLGDVTTGVASVCSPSAAPCLLGNAKTGFAMTIEGGADFKVSKHLSVRGQGGYLMTRFTSHGSRETQNNVRLAAGIVLH